MPSLNIFLIAGEISGDTHGAKLVEALKAHLTAQPSSSQLSFTGLGGTAMQQAGVTLLHDLTRMAALGFGDVVRHYFTYRKIFYAALDYITHQRPDLIILIDFPGFNIRFARAVRRRCPHMPIVYYIAPQVWAWGKRRLKTIARHVDKVLALFPFEYEVYAQAGVEVEVVGHPLVDTVQTLQATSQLKQEFEVQDARPVIALLPGSRTKEVRRILPLLLQAAEKLHQRFPKARFLLSENQAIAQETYAVHRHTLPLKRAHGRTMDLLTICDLALVASGTATLEAALCGNPFIIVYKAGWLTAFLAKRLITLPYIGMVNVLAQREIVPEFLQEKAEPAHIAACAISLLEDPVRRHRMQQDLQNVVEQLGQRGASARAAASVWKLLMVRNDALHVVA